MPESTIFENWEINIDKLPKAVELEFVPIERTYAKVLYIGNGITFFVILALLMSAIFLYIGPLHWLSFGLLTLWLLFLILSFWFAHTSVAHKAYALRQRDISYKSGIFFREWITIPFTRVQHCELSRGVLDRTFGLAELRIFTAGGSSSDISIPGLKSEVAQQLKDFIIAKIKDDDEEE